MLEFFRKNQKIFFIFVTTIIVFSFVFFGTYQAFGPGMRSAPDEVVFQTVDGKKIKRSYLMQLCHFLSNEPAAPFPGRRGGSLGNFLNDGVLSKDFFETDLASLLFKQYSKEMGGELVHKLNREKNYIPYTHPYSKMVSAAAVWKLFAPQVHENLIKLQQLEEASSLEGFQARMHLYLAERRFPPALLSQILRYQEKDTQGLPSDPRLFKEELSLFGYRSAADWFGSSFVEGAAEVILNASGLAKKKGYKVSKEEALIELLARSEKTYQVLKDIPGMPAKNGLELLQFYLKANQLDEETLVKIWQDIMLFRRLFQDAGASPLDTLGMKQFFTSAKEYATIELYQMPQELRFQNANDLKAFEKYLSLVAPSRENILDLPEKFDDLQTIEKRAPELVGRRFTVEVASITKKDLQSKVTVRETWEWEQQESHWDQIKKQFPELASKEATSPSERVQLLDSLDAKRRVALDMLARAAIVNDHPEWIQDVLNQTSMKEKRLFLRGKHLVSPLEGIKDVPALVAQLEKEDTDVFYYTQDQETFYKIQIKEKGEKELFSFADAKKESAIDTTGFDCKSLVKALYKDALDIGMTKSDIPEDQLADAMAPYRFVRHLRQKRDLDGLWTSVKKVDTLMRFASHFIPFNEVIALGVSSASKVSVSPKEGAYYYRFLEKKVDGSIPMDKMIKAQELLSGEAKTHFMRSLLKQMEEKSAVFFTPQEVI